MFTGILTMRILLGTLHSKAKVQIWDALADRKGKNVLLKTHRKNHISWYACGPTVYDSAHIGHASSYIRLDIIRRILERQNYTVLQVMGITDIDDKIIKRANEQGVHWNTLTKKYELEFVNELVDLNVKPPSIRARVTRFIPQIIQFVEQLISNGSAYSTSDGSVYFNTAAYRHYGIFTSMTDDDAQETGNAEMKKNKRDFALWKASKPKEPFWLSPWGQGRPGWHIECSVIASNYFGTSLDIHSGGTDLMFPHHENEEAQCCAHFGLNKWVTHWIHTGHLTMQDGVKMSKSLGNTLKISEFLKNYSPDSLRMLCMMHNHRSHLFFSPEAMNTSKTVIRKFLNFLTDCSAVLDGSKKVTLDCDSKEYLWNKLAATKAEIEDALCNDFDTASALNYLTVFVSDFNRRIQPSSSTSSAISDAVDYELILASQSFVRDFFSHMGFQLESQRVNVQDFSKSLEPILQELIDFRQCVRSFSLASDEANKPKRKELMKERKQLIDACDQVRKNLGNYGVEVKDYERSSSWSLLESETNLKDVN